MLPRRKNFRFFKKAIPRVDYTKVPAPAPTIRPSNAVRFTITSLQSLAVRFIITITSRKVYNH